MDSRPFREQDAGSNRRSNPIDVLEGFLDEALVAATDPLTGATTAEMSVIEWYEDNAPGTPATFYDTLETLTITNRDPTLSADLNTYIVVLKMNGEWRPIWVGCSAAR